MFLQSPQNQSNKLPKKKTSPTHGLKNNKKKRKRKPKNNKNLFSLTKRPYKKQNESNKKDLRGNKC
jgi:hypothetical protein